MTDRYTATIDASGSTVTADIDENDDVEGGRAGALLLYYDGPETGRGLPEKVGERHFYDAEGAGDADGGQVNLDNGATVDFDVPQTYVAGDGVWTRTTTVKKNRITGDSVISPGTRPKV